MRYAIPLGIFIVMVGLLGYGLTRDPRNIPSPLIDKPVPDFSLARLDAPQIQVSGKDFLGQVWVLNVWASWCLACRAEHPVITRLARLGIAPVVGLNYKDKGEEARDWLLELGDPYVFSLVDRDGKVGIDWGVYGVPETFIVDKQGLIRYKYIGPINNGVLDTKIVPLLTELAG